MSPNKVNCIHKIKPYQTSIKHNLLPFQEVGLFAIVPSREACVPE